MSETLGNKAIQCAAESYTDGRTETALVPTVGMPLDDERHERFVHALLAGEPIGDAYQLAGFRSGSRKAAWAHGCRLRARPDVQVRLRELWAVAAERALIKPATLLYELFELATADAGEVSRVVTIPCRVCWPTAVVAAALDRAGADHSEMPSVDEPREGCESCRGHGVQKVIITDTDKLRGPARRLYAGAKTKSDGSVEASIVDQLAARRELHALLGMHVNRSENKNLNISATIPVEADTSVDAILALYHESRDARD